MGRFAKLTDIGSTRTILTDAETIAWNFSDGNVGYVEIEDTRDIVISNVAGVAFGILEVKHLLAGSQINIPGNTEGVRWSTNLNGTTLLGFYFNGDNYVWSSNIGGASEVDLEAPVFQDAKIENSNLTRVVLTFNEALLGSSVPSTTDFTLSGGKTITGITITGSLVYVDFNLAYSSSDSPTISYTPGTTKLKDLAGNLCAALVTEPIVIGVIDVVDWTLESNCTDNGNGGLSFSGTGGAIGAAQLGGVGSYVEYTQPSPVSNTTTIVLSLVASNAASYGMGSFPIAIYHLDGTYYYRSQSSTDVAIGAISAAAGDVLRIERTATNDAAIKISKDGGETFTTYHTSAGALTGIASPYIKATNASSGNNMPNCTTRTTA